jgi:hypothetical protein
MKKMIDGTNLIETEAELYAHVASLPPPTTDWFDHTSLGEILDWASMPTKPLYCIRVKKDDEKRIKMQTSTLSYAESDSSMLSLYRYQRHHSILRASLFKKAGLAVCLKMEQRWMRNIRAIYQLIM